MTTSQSAAKANNQMEDPDDLPVDHPAMQTELPRLRRQVRELAAAAQSVVADACELAGDHNRVVVRKTLLFGLRAALGGGEDASPALEVALAFYAPTGKSSLRRSTYELACWTTEPDRAVEYLRKPDYLKIEWPRPNAPHKVEVMSGGPEFAPNRCVMALVTFEDRRVETRVLMIVDPAEYDDAGRKIAVGTAGAGVR